MSIKEKANFLFREICLPKHSYHIQQSLLLGKYQALLFCLFICLFDVSITKVDIIITQFFSFGLIKWARVSN